MIRSACRPPWEKAQAIVNKGLGLEEDTSSIDAFQIGVDFEMVIPGTDIDPTKSRIPKSHVDSFERCLESRWK